MGCSRTIVILVCAWVSLALPSSSRAQVGWLLAAPPWDEPLIGAFNVFGVASGLPEAEREAYLSRHLPVDDQALMDRALAALQTMVGKPEADRPIVFAEAILLRGAPPSQWRQIRAFDSAESCERLRLQFEKL